MKETTDEYSFVLKPSAYGIGVFAAHDIKEGTYLRMFGENNPLRHLNKKDIPEQFRIFCADRGETMICPPDFGYMPVGWHLNHSSTPNAVHKGWKKKEGYDFFAIRDIKDGEEITIDYNLLEEPEEGKEAYYKS